MLFLTRNDTLAPLSAFNDESGRQKEMQKILVSVALIALLSGCSGFPGVYKIDVQQGNVVTQKMVDQLRPGMTRSQVRYVMGTPLLTDTFHEDRWDYIYTMQEGKGDYSRKNLTVVFENGTLAAISGDYRPDTTN